MQKIFRNIQRKALLLCAWAAITMTAVLTGCGGGGGGGGGGDALTLASLQGRWSTASDDLHGRWVPPATAGKTKGEFWLLSRDGLFLTVLETTVSGGQGLAAKGARYRLDPLSTQGSALEYIDWTGVANVNAAPKTMSFVNGPALSLQDSLSQPAYQGNAVGTWRSDLSFATLTLTVTPAGVITGETTGGCRYLGTLTARSDVTIYEATLEETCSYPQVAVVQFKGIGFISGSLNQLTLALETADKTSGKVLYFIKQ